MQDEPYAYNKSVLGFLEFESLGYFSPALLIIFLRSISLGISFFKNKNYFRKVIYYGSDNMLAKNNIR
jgi:hypothetical protein